MGISLNKHKLMYNILMPSIIAIYKILMDLWSLWAYYARGWLRVNNPLFPSGFTSGEGNHSLRMVLPLQSQINSWAARESYHVSPTILCVPWICTHLHNLNRKGWLALHMVCLHYANSIRGFSTFTGLLTTFPSGPSLAAEPKSTNLMWPDLVMRTFSGLMSRWTNPNSWRSLSPAAIAAR